MLPVIPFTVAYIPEYSYEYSYAHVLFVYSLEKHRPRKQKEISPLLRELIDPLAAVAQTPWTNSAGETEK